MTLTGRKALPLTGCCLRLTWNWCTYMASPWFRVTSRFSWRPRHVHDAPDTAVRLRGACVPSRGVATLVGSKVGSLIGGFAQTRQALPFF